MDNVIINITEQPNNVTINATNDAETVTINIIEGDFGSFNCSDLDDCVNFQAVVSDLSNHISDNGNPHNVTKSQVGLSNVDNTSDVNKPVSTAQQTALNLKEDVANKVTNYNAPDNVTFATTQATVSLVDNRVQSNIKIIGDWDASSGSYPLADESNTTAFIVQWGTTIKAGWAFRVGYGQQGTVGGFEYENGDVVYALVDNPTNASADWGDLDHNLQQATESLRGTSKIITQAIIEDENTLDDEKYITGKKLWSNFWPRVLAIAHTFAAKITFTTAPVFSSTTGGHRLEVDANKNLVSVAKGTADNKDFGTTAGTVLEGSALSFLSRILFKDFTIQGSYTGTTALTQIGSGFKIDGGEVQVGDVVELQASAERDLTTGTGTLYLYCNAVDNLSGALLIGTFAGAGLRSLDIQRLLKVRSTTETEVPRNNISSGNNFYGTAATHTILNIDWTNDVYIIPAYVAASTTQTQYLTSILAKKN